MDFKGELAWLEEPEWRSDLMWVAERAGREVRAERERGRGLVVGACGKGKVHRIVMESEVKVRCVMLTRGGEQA
jgi:hypothetical protein